MPAVVFQQCACGIEFKILYMVDDTRQFYTCTVCRQTIEIVGTVLKMFMCPASSFPLERNWVQVSQENLRSTR